MRCSPITKLPVIVISSCPQCSVFLKNTGDVFGYNGTWSDIIDINTKKDEESRAYETKKERERLIRSYSNVGILKRMSGKDLSNYIATSPGQNKSLLVTNRFIESMMERIDQEEHPLWLRVRSPSVARYPHDNGISCHQRTVLESFFQF